MLDYSVVVGSTGWYDHLTEVKTSCLKQKGACIYASNFSLGVNLFFKMNTLIAELMGQYPMYEPEISEIHHLQKLDSPSGTAITLAEDFIAQSSSVQNWVNHKSSDTNYIGIVSKRLPDVPGTHIIEYTSNIDTIELKHTAHSRDGFAKGALLAAQWLVDKQGFFTMQDVLNF